MAKQTASQLKGSPKPSLIDDLFDLTGMDDLNQVLSRALRMLTRMVNAEAGSLLFQTRLEPPKHKQAGAFRPEALAHIQRWEAFISRRLRQRNWHIHHVSSAIVSQFDIPGSQSLLVSVPLLHGNNVVGVVSMVLPPVSPLSEVQRNLLARVAAGIGQIFVLRQELEVSRRKLYRFSVFYDVGQALITTFDNTSELLANTMELATRLIDSGAASILLIDPEKKELVFRVSHGARSELLRQHRIPMGEGIAGWVAQTGRPVIANDARADSRFSQRVDVRTGFLTQSIAAVPLKFKGRVIGVLEVLNKYSGEGFSQDDIQILSFIGSQAAIAIQNSRAYNQLLMERDRIVQTQSETHREITSSLHDGILQYLSAISLSLEHLNALSKNTTGMDVLEHQIIAMQNLMTQATANTRNLLLQLRPPMLETQGLVAACRYYINQLGNIGTMSVHFSAPERVVIEQKTSVALFSIIQEALNNIVEHSNADDAWLKIELDDDTLRVIIADDGQGFNVALVEQDETEKAKGLPNIKKLAQAIHATLKIESATQMPNHGTTIAVSVPLTPR
jgi:signal transduction histidine kinase